MTSTLVLSLLAVLTGRSASAQQTPPVQAIQYKSIQQANINAAEDAERAKKRRKQQAQDDQQGMQQMMGALQQMNGGMTDKNGRRRRNPDADSNPMSVANEASKNTGISSGKLEPCGSVPAKVQSDLQEMMEFRKSCAAANKGSNQKFAINEYRESLGTPTMYLFDSSGECKYKTSVSFGSGKVRGPADGAPKACAADKSHSTPAGMHLTVPHKRSPRADYNESNSLGLAGLEDQKSDARGILIHGSNSPGEGYSYGCSGVGCIPDVMRFLGYGALVFNSFDDDQTAPGCSDTAGMKRNGTCRAETPVNVSDASPGITSSGKGDGVGGTGAAQ